jgi:hypothetical protein
MYLGSWFLFNNIFVNGFENAKIMKFNNDEDRTRSSSKDLMILEKSSFLIAGLGMTFL